MAIVSFKVDKPFILLAPELIKFRHYWPLFGAGVDDNAITVQLT
jgi:hypothetical protein